MVTDSQTLPLFTKELVASYVFTLLAGGLVAAAQFILPRQVPLWYSLVIPEQQLVPKLFLGLFPALMLAVCLIHTLIISKLKQIDATIVKIFSFGTTLVTFLFLVGTAHIVYLFL